MLKSEIRNPKSEVRRVVDFRTDTSTLPTEEMREAMRRAEVGNDELGEDPTVNRLQAMAADLLGKEAAMYMPSGTLGNLIALVAQSGPGRAVLFGAWSHIEHAEGAGAAQVGGVMTIPLDDSAGAPDPDQVRSACRRVPGRAAVLALENTHNFNGGMVLPAKTLWEYRALADEMGVRLHLDGARLFHAAVALGVPAAELAAPAHSVMFCLSKGLCAPVGSLLVSDRGVIERAWTLRKMLGGQMRQAGVLAAAGIVSLERMVSRLPEDHANARRLADGLRRIAGLDVPEPQTNLVLCRPAGRGLSPQQFVERAAAAGVLAFAFGGDRVRFCLYRDITAADVDHALASLRQALEG